MQFDVADVLSATLDVGDMSISFAKNGRSLGKAFSGLSPSLRSEEWFPAVAMRVRERWSAARWSHSAP